MLDIVCTLWYNVDVKERVVILSDRRENEMMYGEEQRKEIETIAARTVVLNLSDADCKRISEKAGEVGMTVAQLLENFIGDLVNGTYTNGSDERMYAEEWFNRCGFAMFPSNTFLRWLIERISLEEVLGLWNDIQQAKEELAEGDAVPGYWEPGERESILEDIDCWQKDIDEHWNEYVSFWGKVKHEVGAFEEEMKKVLDWQEECQRLMTGVSEAESEE